MCTPPTCTCAGTPVTGNVLHDRPGWPGHRGRGPRRHGMWKTRPRRFGVRDPQAQVRVRRQVEGRRDDGTRGAQHGPASAARGRHLSPWLLFLKNLKSEPDNHGLTRGHVPVTEPITVARATAYANGPGLAQGGALPRRRGAPPQRLPGLRGLEPPQAAGLAGAFFVRRPPSARGSFAKGLRGETGGRETRGRGGAHGLCQTSVTYVVRRSPRGQGRTRGSPLSR